MVLVSSHSANSVAMMTNFHSNSTTSYNSLAYIGSRRLVNFSLVSCRTLSSKRFSTCVNLRCQVHSDSHPDSRLVSNSSSLSAKRYAKEKSGIIMVGFSFHKAPVEIREKLSIPEAELPQTISELCGLNHIEEAAVLSTCNEMEIYAVALSPRRGVKAITEWMSKVSGAPVSDIRQHQFLLYEKEAIKHLSEVSYVLDPLILGEGKILAQVKHIVKVGQVVPGFGRKISGQFMHAITARKQVNKGTNLPSEFVTNEYADAASEALALARFAVKIAKSTMMMNHESPKALNIEEKSKLPESDISIKYPSHKFQKRLNPQLKTFQLLEEQLPSSKTVRSKRQVERKERRIRAVEKAEASDLTVKSASKGVERGITSTVAVKPGLTRKHGEKNVVLAFWGGMTNTKLLTAAEEVELSKGIQDLLKLQEVYKEWETRFGVPPTFAEWAAAAKNDQLQLGRRLQYGEECRNKMIRSNIRLVNSVAKRYYGKKVHIQDIFQDGIRGLVKSAERFDASKGFKFSTYAHWWIKDAVLKSRAEHRRIIHVPFYLVEMQSKVHEAKYRLYKQLGRKPTYAEIEIETGLSTKSIQSAENVPRPARSLDIPSGVENNIKLTDFLDDPDQETPEKILIKKTMSEDIEKVLSMLEEKEKQVIKWRFGLEDGKSRSFGEIRDVMGVTREGVRQIELRAFRKLRNIGITETLRQYLIL